ncbi:MAG: RHS repeat-associated core domain-containing protein, partial [Bacteroidales bacterium]|nr:RHS repeat-associated core domain-containing protein [Bacteroidales bacterium]
QSFCSGKAKGEYSNNKSKNSENAQFEGDIRFYHPDHLGRTTVVTDLDGEVTQNVAYIPYGEVFVEQRNGTWNTPYLFNAKELDEETGLYYYGARYLDPTGTRWLSVDPLFEKYVGMTPYGYCAGNPVKLVDPNGEDIYVFDEDGNFSHKIAQEGEHIGRYQSGDVTVDFKFADPINDPKAIDGESFDEYGNQIIINRIEVKSVTEIDNALWNSGVYNKENQDNKWSFAMNEADASDISKGNGRMDYVVTANFERGKEQKVLNDVGEVADIDSHTLYITKTKSGYYAHNDHNFGNFLWGAGMKALGFNESTAKLGADIFAIRKHGELDSKDDQLSIKLGYEWGKK